MSTDEDRKMAFKQLVDSLDAFEATGQEQILLFQDAEIVIRKPTPPGADEMDDSDEGYF